MLVVVVVLLVLVLDSDRVGDREGMSDADASKPRALRGCGLPVAEVRVGIPYARWNECRGPERCASVCRDDRGVSSSSSSSSPSNSSPSTPWNTRDCPPNASTRACPAASVSIALFGGLTVCNLVRRRFLGDSVVDMARYRKSCEWWSSSGSQVVGGRRLLSQLSINSSGLSDSIGTYGIVVEASAMFVASIAVLAIRGRGGVCLSIAGTKAKMVLAQQRSMSRDPAAKLTPVGNYDLGLEGHNQNSPSCIL